LAEDSPIPPNALRTHISQLPVEVRNVMLKGGKVREGAFWCALRNPDQRWFNHLCYTDPLGRVAGILALIRLAEMWQDEQLHFFAHRLLAHLAIRAAKFDGDTPGIDLFALQLRRFLRTKYWSVAVRTEFKQCEVAACELLSQHDVTVLDSWPKNNQTLRVRLQAPATPFEVCILKVLST
jgi:hypothetical protein